MDELVDPIIKAIRAVSTESLENDKKILEVIKALIEKVNSLEQRIMELELGEN